MANSFKSLARFAGALYVTLALTGAFSILFVSSRMIVMDDADKTYSNLTAGETLFRIGIAAGQFHAIVFLILSVVLFALLERYGRLAAALIVVFVVAGVPLYYVATLQELAILPLLGQDGSTANEVMQHLEQHETVMKVTTIFWGLWLLPLGYLVMKSAIIPRVLGLLLLLGGVGYVANYFGPLLLEGGYPFTWIGMPLAIASVLGEVGTALWLLVMGAKQRDPEPAQNR